MEYLSEDPRYLAGGLAILAGAFLIAMRVTQQGKFLVWAGVALVLAVLVVGIEWVWVTDNERIERVVYDLGRAVETSNAPAALADMTSDVQFVQKGSSLPGELTRALVQGYVANTEFDFLRISHLTVHAGEQSRRGTAEFRVVAAGNFRESGGLAGPASGTSSWSLGFVETSPGVWKVNRISPVQLPGGVDLSATGSRSSNQVLRSPSSYEFDAPEPGRKPRRR